MKTTTKRFLSMLAAASLTAGCLAGCGGGDTSTDPAATDGTDGAAAEEPVEIDVMCWDRGTVAPGTTIEDNALTQWIQEEVLKACNVKVNYVAIPRSESDDKLNAMMASGTAPDLILTFDRNLFLSYADQGGLADLGPSIEKYGDNIQEYLSEVLDLGVVDGVQYCVPQYKGVQAARHVSFIRKDWLDKLGLPVPTNKEELIEALYAFKEQDPGGVGKDKVVPWAMSGDTGTEKAFANFVFSYAEDWDDESMYVYHDYAKTIKPGTKEGYDVLNQLYNDGIISKDFAIDTQSDKFKQDIVNGNVGFFVEDTTRYWGDYAQALQANVPEANFIPVNVFENKNGEYVNPGNTLHGRWVMVPKTSEDKVDAVVKFMNWMAVPENSMKIGYTPDYKTTEDGVPITPTEEELYAAGYPKNISDFSFINGTSNVEEYKKWSAAYPFLSEDYFKAAQDVMYKDVYYEPVPSKIPEAELKYGSNFNTQIVEFAFKTISAPRDQFETVYTDELDRVMQSSGTAIIEGRTEMYQQEQASK